MPRLSVIIAATAAPDPLEETLLSVLESRPPQCDIVVAVAGNYLDPYDLGGEVAILNLPPTTAWSDLVRQAVERTTSDAVLLLSAGARWLPKDWTDWKAAFGDPDVGIVAPTLISAAGSRFAGLDPDRADCTWIPIASRDESSPSGWALGVRKSAWTAVGGFDPNFGPGRTELDLLHTLRAGGWKLAASPCEVQLPEEAFASPALGFAAGAEAARFLARRHPGIGGWAAALGQWLDDAAQSPTAALGHFWGWLTSPDPQAWLDRVDAARQARRNRSQEVPADVLNFPLEAAEGLRRAA